ncbi:MAG: 4Fe-4S ferredoxin iron-sulfur binding domain-containing protein, partial [Candidatus Berkelbacteria bacterium Licking1014_2]
SYNMVILANIIKKIDFLNGKKDIQLLTEKAITEVLGDKEGLVNNLKVFSQSFTAESIYYKRRLPKEKISRREIRAFDKEKEHYIFPWLCKSCATCIYRCPQKALHFSAKTNSIFAGQPATEVDIKKCLGCGLCQQVCPERAIRVIKRPK